MSLCVDTNVLVSQFFEDAQSRKVDLWLKEKPRDIVLSRWAAALARDPALKLSAADALHLALCGEGGHSLVTFDLRLIEAARVRGYSVESI